MAHFANILHDEAFKVVLSEPSNNRLLIKLVEFFLPGKHIASLSLDDKEQHGLILSEKNSTFDLFCTTDTGERLIVEMQFSQQDSFQDRMLYYATYPIRSQIMRQLKDLNETAEEERHKMDYRLNPVYVISILNFKLPHERTDTLEEGLISRYDIRSERSGELMTDALHFVYLELGRLRWNKDEWAQCGSLLEQLAFSLKYGHLLGERPVTFEDELLRLLYDATEFARMEPGQIRILNAIMTTELDIIAQRAFARKEGRQEGLEEGRQEGREEERRAVVLKSLELGLSPETISQITGLTVDEVNALASSADKD